VWYGKSSSKKEIFRNKCPYQKKRFQIIIIIKTLRIHHKDLEGQEKTKCKISRKKEIKIRVEENKIEI
jgi:hypothetical protein